MEPQEETLNVSGQRLTGNLSNCCLADNSILTANNTSHTRGQVTEFSTDSKNRLKSLILSSINHKYFITITYGMRYPIGNSAIRQEQKRLCKHLRNAGIHGIWKIEFQKRGAVHFHIIAGPSNLGANHLKRVINQFYTSQSNYDRGSWRKKIIYNLPRLAYYLTFKEKPPLPSDWQGRLWANFGFSTDKPNELEELVEPLEQDDQPEPNKQPPSADEAGFGHKIPPTLPPGGMGNQSIARNGDLLPPEDPDGIADRSDVSSFLVNLILRITHACSQNQTKIIEKGELWDITSSPNVSLSPELALLVGPTV